MIGHPQVCGFAWQVGDVFLNATGQTHITIWRTPHCRDTHTTQRTQWVDTQMGGHTNELHLDACTHCSTLSVFSSCSFFFLLHPALIFYLGHRWVLGSHQLLVLPLHSCNLQNNRLSHRTPSFQLPLLALQSRLRPPRSGMRLATLFLSFFKNVSFGKFTLPSNPGQNVSHLLFRSNAPNGKRGLRPWH